MKTDELFPDVEGLKQEELRELVDSVRVLSKSHGWKYISSVLKDQYNKRMYELLCQPLKAHDEVLAQEYTKGECASLLLLAGLLPNMVEYLETLLKATNPDEPENSE